MTEPTLNMPLVQAIQRHSQTKPHSFHVPGHKNGSIIPTGLEDFKNILHYDLTEIEGMDDLHDPTGPIKEAQQLLAKYYQASESFFLVGGTTVGNLAMVYALCEPGDVVFVQRNSHKSILHAVELAGVTPVYLASEVDESTGIAMGVTEEILQEALQNYPEATALIMTYPTYYGVCRSPEKVIQRAQQAGLLVMVDEAHGAHFAIGEPFPVSALSVGADVVVHSAHKTLPALTMGSYLHVGERLHANQITKIKRALSIFQSSSPSYLIMASLDAARAYLQSYTNEQLTSTIASIQAFKEGISLIPQLEVVQWEKSGYSYDPLKVTIKSISSLTGYQLQELLHHGGIDVEMADEQHILLVMGLEPMEKRGAMLSKLSGLLATYQVNENQQQKESFRHVSSEEYIKHIHTYKTKRIRFWEAEGWIAAEAVIPYPPGIPLLYPGQQIDKAVLQQIDQLQQAGARFQGIDVVENGICVAELEDRI